MVLYLWRNGGGQIVSSVRPGTTGDRGARGAGSPRKHTLHSGSTVRIRSRLTPPRRAGLLLVSVELDMAPSRVTFAGTWFRHVRSPVTTRSTDRRPGPGTARRRSAGLGSGTGTGDPLGRRSAADVSPLRATTWYRWSPPPPPSPLRRPRRMRGGRPRKGTLALSDSADRRCR